MDLDNDEKDVLVVFRALSGLQEGGYVAGPRGLYASGKEAADNLIAAKHRPSNEAIVTILEHCVVVRPGERETIVRLVIAWLDGEVPVEANKG